MYKKPSLLLLIIIILAGKCGAQDAGTFRDEAGYMALAYRMIKYGFENKQPLILTSAAMILAEHPAAGTFKPVITDPGEKATIHGSSTADINALLDTAQAMAGSDSITIMAVKQVREKLARITPKDRGRKYSPYVQEYAVKKNSSVTVTATFNGNETAEVFVIPYKSALMDLYIYNEKGKLIVSDKGHADNCYSTFTPKKTAIYKIEIRNREGRDNDCLLMTN